MWGSRGGTTGVTGILVETDASDTVTKCESYDRAFDGNRSVVPCVCKAITAKVTASASKP